MRALVSAFIIAISSTAAYAQGLSCSSLFSFLPSTSFIEENSPIRIDDEAKRIEYASSLLSKSDLLVDFDGMELKFTRARLSSLIESIFADPAFFVRRSSSPASLKKLEALRKKLNGSSAPGSVVPDRHARAWEVLVGQSIGHAAAERLRRTDWFGEIPSLIANRGVPSDPKSLILLEHDAAEILVDERARQASGLLALGDRSVGVIVIFISAQGAKSVTSFNSISEALLQIQSSKPQLCGALIEFRRVWLDRAFLSRYASLDKAQIAHTTSLIDVWDRDSVRISRDWNVFSFLPSAHYVSGILLTIQGDRIVLDKYLINTLVQR